MLSLTERNLVGIREEYDKISKTIARFSFVRATVFVIGAFAVASALNKISSSKTNEIVEELRSLYRTTQDAPAFGNVFGDIFLDAIYGRLFLRDSTSSEGAQRPTAGSQPDTSTSEVPPEVKAEAQRREGELVEELRRITNDAFTFTFKAPLLGTDVKVDLKIWAFLLPLAVILAETYLSILRHKRRTVYTLGDLIVRRDPSSATVLDQLQFGQNDNRPAAFSRHPNQYEVAVSLIGAIALAIYVARSGVRFWQGWDSSSKNTLFNFYAIAVIYAIAYAAYAKRQLNEQILPVRGLRSFGGKISRFLRLVSVRARSVAKRIAPKLNLTTGSLMVLGTLWLLVAAPWGCQKRLTGLEYLKEPDGWFSGPFAEMNAFTSFHNRIVWALYALGLLLAALSLLMLLCSSFAPKVLYRNKLTLLFGRVTTVVCLFFITDLSFGDILDYCGPSSGLDFRINLLFLSVAVLMWPIPIGAWFLHRRGKPNWRERWRLKRRSLVRWYQPQIAFAAFLTALAFLRDDNPLIGVPIFLIGTALLAAAYATLATNNKRQASHTTAQTLIHNTGRS